MGNSNVATQSEIANQFELSSGPIQVTYSSSSIAGVPILSYRSRGSSQSFRGRQIRQTQTELGTLVSVTLSSVPDLKTVVFSLLLPTVRVTPGSGPMRVELPGVETTIHTTIVGPPLGPEQTYEVYGLRGTAQFVVF